MNFNNVINYCHPSDDYCLKLIARRCFFVVVVLNLQRRKKVCVSGQRTNLFNDCFFFLVWCNNNNNL